MGHVGFVQIATLLNAKIKQDVLSDIGNLEQDFVYGDATIKELINILNVNQVQNSKMWLDLCDSGQREKWGFFRFLHLQFLFVI
jgi:hypothetical protein